MIHANTQIVMKKLMERLEIPIPKFTLSRWAEVELQNQKLVVQGIDENGQPLNVFRYVIAIFDSRKEN